MPNRFFALVLAALFLTVLPGMEPKAFAMGHNADPEFRTVNRSVQGFDRRFMHLRTPPEFLEFLPTTRGYHPKHTHDAQWVGQEWDYTAWDQKNWTPDRAVARLFDSKIFLRQTNHRGAPALEVGEGFFDLSPLDQQRSLKLLSDYTELFVAGHDVLFIKEGRRGKVVGLYTPSGLRLD